jgi:5-methylcytosine-specific restriction endonuclease McrA
MLTDEVRKFVFSRDNWHCRHCNNSHGLDPHHVVFKSAGGLDKPSNLLTLCRWCHDSIHGGRLRVEVINVFVNDLEVKFWKQKGWQPFALRYS